MIVGRLLHPNSIVVINSQATLARKETGARIKYRGGGGVALC